MLTHRGFSACIESNGSPLPEYLVSVDEKASRVSCWIPGIEGQTFKVHWCDEGSKVSTCAFIILDGVTVPGRFLHGEGAATRSGVRVSRTTERPFVFKKLKETDLAAQEDSKEAGLIILKVKRIKCMAPRAPNPIRAVPSVGVLGLRKEGDLCVGFGEEMEVDAQYGATWEVSSFESEKPGVKPHTFVSFAFRYRSPEFLEAQGIASMEQTQPWVAHTRRLTRRTVSLPMPLSEPHDSSESVNDSAPSSAISTPLIGQVPPTMRLPPPTALLNREDSREIMPPPTPASSSSELNSSPDQIVGRLPPHSSRDSTPALSESDGEAGRRSAAPSESSPTETEPDKSLGRLGKGKAPAIWRQWVHPSSRPTDPRRTVSWKIPKSSSADSGGSSRSIRGVKRTPLVDDNPCSPQAFEGAFMVSLPRPQTTRTVDPKLPPQ